MTDEPSPKPFVQRLQENPHWLAFGALALAVPLITFVAGRAAGIQQSNLGLSTLFEARTVRPYVDRALGSMLVKDRLAAWLAGRSEVPAAFKPLKSTTGPVRWALISDIADRFTSDAARGRLAALLTKLVRPRESAFTADEIAAFRGPTPDGSAVMTALGLTESAIRTTFDSWTAVELPDEALNSLYVKNNAVPPAVLSAKGLRAAVWQYFQNDGYFNVLAGELKDALRTTRADPGTFGPAAKDFAARTTWAAAAVVFTTLAIVAILVGLILIYQLAGDRLALAVIFTALAALVATQFPAASTPFIGHLFARYHDVYELNIVTFSSWLNVLAGAAIVALIGSAWAASIIPPNTDDEGLRNRLQALRWSMNLATALLVAGVLEVFALSQWPAAFAPADVATMITEAATTSAVAVGVVFSVLLLVLYVPGSVSLQEHAHRLVKADPTKKQEIDDILTETGFNEKSTDMIKRFVQAVLPLLITGSIKGIAGIL